MTRPLLPRLYGSAVIAAHLRGQARTPFLPREDLDALQDRRVRRIVAYAARCVPFYRELFAREGIDARDIRGARDLERLPLLGREEVRADPKRFVAEARPARGALSFLTSGTTGAPLQVFHDRRSVLANIAYGERERQAVNALCGGAFRPKELYVGYQTSTFKKVIAFYAGNTLMPVRPRRRFVSLDTSVDEIVEIANAEKPDVLVGYGGWVDLFFRTVRARGLEVHQPKVVMYMGEALPPGGRESIEIHLGLPVMSRYNAVEAFKIGYYCEARTGFHVHEDLCVVRIAGPDGTSLSSGEPGQVVISNLINRATVLLNYPIGDVGSLSEQPCPCGRTFALLSELEGRVEDILHLPDGRFVHPRAVWEVFKPEGEILRYQLVERAVDRFELRLAVTTEAAYPAVLERVLPRLRRLLGPGLSLESEHRSEAEFASDGKFRAVVSRRSGVPAD